MAQFEISLEDMGLAAMALPANIMQSLMYDGTHINGSEAAVAQVSGLDFNALRKADLLRYAAQKRWEKEVGGVTINEMQIDTSRESQALINGAYNMAKEDANFVTQFKASGGFVGLNAETIIAVALAVGAHVAACFAAEATAVEGINSGNMTTRAHVDAALGI